MSVLRHLCSLLLIFGVFAGSGRAFGADAIPGEELCDQRISGITFRGNRVTRDSVMERELVQAIGMRCSLDSIIDGIQNIMDLGLFKSVRAELLQTRNGLQLRYVVKEKFFFLAIPRFSRTSDGELRLGMQLRWDNFTGRLHQVKLTSEKRQEDEGRGRSGFVHSLDYNVPRFADSRFGLAVSAGARRRQTELSQDDVIYGEAVSESRQLAVQLAHWVNRSRGIRGLRYFGGFHLENREYDLRDGEIGPFLEGMDVGVVAGFETSDIHLDDYRRTGMAYGASIGISSRSLGSEFDYHRADLWGAWYRALPGGLRNLNIKARLGLSDGAAFGTRGYSIGGGEVLRGVAASRDTGDLLTLVNVEYLEAFFVAPTWRWVAFMDIGNVFHKGDTNWLNQNLRAGLGLRWKIEALTNTDLRVDVAWDPDENELTPYIATSLTF